MNRIEVITCKSGDWEILKVDNKFYYQGHTIPNRIWLELFEDIGIEVVKYNISDEEMEFGKYNT